MEQAAARGRDQGLAHDHDAPESLEAEAHGHGPAWAGHHGHHRHDAVPAAAVPWDQPVFEVPRSYDCPAWPLGRRALADTETGDTLLDLSAAQTGVPVAPIQAVPVLGHGVGYWAHAPPRAEHTPLYLQTSVLLI